MRPLLLKMTNFLSYEDEEFDFSQVTNATITGRNGAGKSSFCTDAITWALFGKGSRGSEKESGNYVSTGADSCTVELTFELNKSEYKVIRSVRANKGNRMALNLFVIDKDGNEVPLTGARLGDTQDKIEKLIKMSYKTFTASSMIFQGKSDEFTNGMSNAERKEALINILNINEWERVGEKAKAELSQLKQSLRNAENQRDVKYEITTHKKEYIERKKVAEDKLKAIAQQKEACEQTIEKNQKAIFQRDGISADIKQKENEKRELNNRVESGNKDMKVQQNMIEKYNRSSKQNDEDIARQQAILGRKKEIDEAVEKEKVLVEEVNGIWEKQRKFSDARANLDQIGNDGKIWKSKQESDLKMLDGKIAEAQKQAKALDAVPCANDEKLSSTCMFLKMAREAKASLEKLTQERENIAKAVNPYAQKWKDAKELKDSLMINPDEAKAKQEELRKVQTVARLKPVLESAAGNIALLLRNNADIEERIKESKARIDTIREQFVKDKETMKSIDGEIAELKKAMSGFDEVFKEQEQAKRNLESLKQQENVQHGEIGSCDVLLKQVEKAEVELKDIDKEVSEISNDINDTELLIEACGKNSGVPALIVENAVPELEAEANLILENMMDGRLQIRLDTQIETNKGTKQEVFRITVLDDGYERRYETYSGAEKFVVDLALRIAMSKFLCKRSGASVSLFVLDEGVSCADESNRDEIIKAIRSITTEFDVVLFVTHIEELKDALDQRIEVTKTSMGSHIKLR